TLMDHKGATQSLAFTPDSLYLISACSMEVVNVWYVQDLMDTVSEVPCSPTTTIGNALDMGVLSLDISKSIRMEGVCLSFLFMKPKHKCLVIINISLEQYCQYMFMVTNINTPSR
ncbi:hypothetical protein HHI36_024258, partial [Cryptolaemus montrouzieri]